MKLTLDEKPNYNENYSDNILSLESTTNSLEHIEKEKELNISVDAQQNKELNYYFPNEIKGKEILEKDFIIPKDHWEINYIKDNAFVSFFMDLYNKPVPIKEKIETDEISKKSTDEKSIKIKKCIFGIKSRNKIEPRIDYAIKHFKVYTIKFIKEYGNSLIKICNFPNKLKKFKLFSPSYKYFTGNSNDKENKLFLNFTIEKIFCYPEGKIEKNDNRLQRKNKEIIQSFKEYIENEYPEEIPEKFKNLLNYFKMTFQDAVELFYNSKKFNNYTISSKTIFLDEYFIKAKGFSLLEKNGFIKLITKKP